MFKRIKTIGLTLVGLLAMLGTKAEAHYMYAGGDWYYHSVGCQATIGDLPTNPDPLRVTCTLDVLQVELLCPDMTTVSLNFNLGEIILKDYIDIPAGQTEAEVLVDDDSLLNLAGCTGEPIHALIRNMASTVTISVPPLVTSTATATCTLPDEYSIFEYNSPLFDPWVFDCTDPIIAHVN